MSPAEEQLLWNSGASQPGFEAVLEVFVDNFVLRRELVGACCAFVCGEKVVDLWGGIRNRQSAHEWCKHITTTKVEPQNLLGFNGNDACAANAKVTGGENVGKARQEQWSASGGHCYQSGEKGLSTTL